MMHLMSNTVHIVPIWPLTTQQKHPYDIE